MNKLADMPKLESPFEREEIPGKGYVCVPKFKREFCWIIQPDKVIATEKFDGTNVSVYLEDGRIKAILNRENRIDIWKDQAHFYEGIKNAIDEKKFKPNRLLDGQYFGELIGPKLQGNPYNITKPLWLPFDWVKENYMYKFYNDWLLENFPEDKELIDEYVYDKFETLFRDLRSLWFRQKENGRAKHPEGIVFHNKETGEMCKLRLDMFGMCKRNSWDKCKDLEVK